MTVSYTPAASYSRPPVPSNRFATASMASALQPRNHCCSPSLKSPCSHPPPQAQPCGYPGPLQVLPMSDFQGLHGSMSGENYHGVARLHEASSARPCFRVCSWRGGRGTGSEHWLCKPGLCGWFLPLYGLVLPPLWSWATGGHVALQSTQANMHFYEINTPSHKNVLLREKFQNG
jgi:hypothetical protein